MSSWELKEFKVEKKWNKDHYEAEVRFQNKDYEQFKLSLSPEQTRDILILLKPDLAFKTRQLCDTLMEELEDQILNKKKEP